MRQRIAIATVGGLVLLVSPARGVEPAEGRVPPDAITATFSIVAADPQTGVCGAAVASKYPSVGTVVPYVRAGVGALARTTGRQERRRG